MGIFGYDSEEERKEIVEEILDLYNAMNGKKVEELTKSHCAYSREYKKILHKLDKYYNQDILGPRVPQILEELIQEIENPEMVLSSTTITRVEMGLRKIARMFEIKLPEKQLKSEAIAKTIIHNTFNPTQSQLQKQSQEINPSPQITEILVKLDYELKKPIKNNSKIRELITKSVDLGFEAITAVLKLLNRTIFS